MINLNPNILHLRPLPVVEGESEPTGGVTVAYFLREHQCNVVAVCGISLCSFQDNFNRKQGRNRAVGRLMSVLDYPIELHKNLGMVQYLNVGSVSEIQEATKGTVGLQKFVEALSVGGKVDGPVCTTAPYDFGGEPGAFLFLREEDWPIIESLKEGVIGNLIEYRQATYNGDDEFIQEDISEMFVDYIGDDLVDDDEDEDEEDDGLEIKLP